MAENKKENEMTDLKEDLIELNKGINWATIFMCLAGITALILLRLK